MIADNSELCTKRFGMKSSKQIMKDDKNFHSERLEESKS